VSFGLLDLVAFRAPPAEEGARPASAGSTPIAAIAVTSPESIAIPALPALRAAALVMMSADGDSSPTSRWTPGDNRQWPDIDAWAEEIAHELRAQE